MLLPLLPLQTHKSSVLRTSAIYRCPATEAESKFFSSFVEECEFDSLCIEPSPGPTARRLASNKFRFVTSKSIDTKANIKWRDATVAWADGRISPAEWVSRTRRLRETVHFLSWPKAPSLREATGQISARAVLAEMLLLSIPGRPCLTADDTGSTRYLPSPGRLQSWYLAMNDYLGPMLYARAEDYRLVAGPLKIVRADKMPGLLVFRYEGKHRRTFYFNNAKVAVPLPAINVDQVGMVRGLNLDSAPVLMPGGSLCLTE